jgi:hypothetical protein
MHNELFDRIEVLERANRRWKLLAAGLGLVLALVLVLVGFVGTFLGIRATAERQRAVQAMEEARMQESEARRAAEQARMQESEARRAAEQVLQKLPPPDPKAR